MSSRNIWLALILLLPLSALRADEVQVGKKDRLSGTILGMKGRKLTLATTVLGNQAIPWDAVSDVRSDTELAIYLQGEKVVVGLLAGIDGTSLRVQTREGIQTVDVDQVVEISTEIPRGEKPQGKATWGGRAEFGFAWVDGNSHRLGYSLGGQTMRRSAVSELQFRAQGEHGQSGGGKRDAALISAGFTYNRTQVGRLYLSFANDAQHDDVRALLFRDGAALSLGYRVVQKAPNAWSMELGVQDTYQNYNGPDVGRQNDVSMRVQSLTEWRLFRGTQLRFAVVAFPSVQLDHFRSTGDLSLSFPLVGTLNLTLNLTDDYDDAAPLAHKNDLRTRTVLAYGF